MRICRTFDVIIADTIRELTELTFLYMATFPGWDVWGPPCADGKGYHQVMYKEN